MNYKKTLVEAGKQMLAKNLTVETWGNISIRDPETGHIYLTPSAMDYNEIVESDIVVVDIDGNKIEGERKPTIETQLHLSIYRSRPKVNAVIHTHPIYSTIFGVLGEDIPPVIDEAAQIMGESVKVAKYGLPGSAELMENCLSALGDSANACLLAAHGAVCLGQELSEAFKVCAVLELTAQIYYMARSIGTPNIITREHINIMHDFAYNKYGQGK